MVLLLWTDTAWYFCYELTLPGTSVMCYELTAWYFCYELTLHGTSVMNSHCMVLLLWTHTAWYFCYELTLHGTSGVCIWSHTSWFFRSYLSNQLHHCAGDEDVKVHKKHYTVLILNCVHCRLDCFRFVKLAKVSHSSNDRQAISWKENNGYIRVILRILRNSSISKKFGTIGYDKVGDANASFVGGHFD